MANRFLSAKQRLLESGDIASRTYAEYEATTDRIARVFGATRAVEDLGAEELKELRADIGKTWGAIRTVNEVGRVKAVFRYGHEAGLLPRLPTYGTEFRRPSKRTLRLERASRPARYFEPAELRQLIEAAGVHLRSMVLLAANCGFGNHDCEALPVDAVDLNRGR